MSEETEVLAKDWVARSWGDRRKEVQGYEFVQANKSGLSPLGRAVLLEHYEPERKIGLIVIPENVKDRTAMLEQRAVVIELGPHCYPDEPARCKAGDKVMVAKMAGYLTTGPADGKRYLMVNDRDIFAKITKEKEL